MAEGDGTAYNHFKEQLLLGEIDLVDDTLKICLIGNGYAFNPDGNNGYANISANEIVASNYSAGGETLTGKTVTQNDTADNAMFDAANVTWTSLGAPTAGTLAHAIIYDETVTAPVADPLLIRFEIDTQPNGGNYTLDFNAAGIAVLS